MTSRASGRALALLTVALVGAVAAAPAAAKTKIFSSGPVNRAIPDTSSNVTFFIEDFIRIRKRGRVKDVNVAVRISHADNRFIDMELFHGATSILVGELPDAPTLRRWRDLSDPKGADFGAGAPDCGGGMTVFDSQSPLSVVAGSSPYAGTFAPLSSLDVFRRKALGANRLSGKWRLELGDIEAGDAGVLNCWELTIRYKPLKGKLEKKSDKKPIKIKT